MEFLYENVYVFDFVLIIKDVWKQNDQFEYWNGMFFLKFNEIFLNVIVEILNFEIKFYKVFIYFGGLFVEKIFFIQILKQ